MMKAKTMYSAAALSIAAVSLALVVTAAGAFDPAAPPPGGRNVVRANPQEDILALPRPKVGRAKPLIAIVAQNDGAETTDFMIPLGILRDSGVADVRSVSTTTGPVSLMPNFRIVADQTTQAFDAAETQGADIIIVPAQHASEDPALTSWVKAQAAKGAVIVSICEGARVLASAGLLKGKRATTHWYAASELRKRYPETNWVGDRRYVQDGNIISTSGVTASIPVSLALVEAIGGTAAAKATADRLGARGWTSAHRSADFVLRPSDAANVLLSYVMFWSGETVEAPLSNGMDEVSLALRSDAWTRSYRASVVSTGVSDGAVKSLHGLMILPDGEPKRGRLILPGHDGTAVTALAEAVGAIRLRYGPRAARLTVLGLEYDPQSPLERQ